MTRLYRMFRAEQAYLCAILLVMCVVEELFDVDVPADVSTLGPLFSHLRAILVDRLARFYGGG